MSSKKQLLDRYLKGKATQEEVRTVEEWLASFENFSSYELSSVSEYERKQIKQRILANTLSKSYRFSSPLLIAAVVALALVFGGALFWLSKSGSTQQEMLVKSTSDYRAKITLSDGSRVWLNKNSTFTYPKTFTDTTRTVYLEGEAFFQISRDEHLPFIVVSEGVSTRVLGTSFNVNAYAHSQEVKVSVSTGKVAVSSTASEGPQLLAQLTANMELVYNATTLQTEVSSSVATATDAWRNKQLIFVNTPLSQIIETLENWYQVSIKLKSTNLGKCTFTANFESDTSLTDLLNMLSIASDLHYVKEGNTIIIDGNACY